MASISEYLKRGYSYLSRLFGRPIEEEEPEEEEPLEEPRLPPEAEEAEEGALAAGEMTTGAAVPTYRKDVMPEQVRFTSQTEEIISELNYMTEIRPDLIYKHGAVYYHIDQPIQVEGIFTGDPVAFVPTKGNFNAPGTFVAGTITVLVYNMLRDGTQGRIIMQKKMKYERWTPGGTAS